MRVKRMLLTVMVCFLLMLVCGMLLITGVLSLGGTRAGMLLIVLGGAVSLFMGGKPKKTDAAMAGR